MMFEQVKAEQSSRTANKASFSARWITFLNVS